MTFMKNLILFLRVVFLTSRVMIWISILKNMLLIELKNFFSITNEVLICDFPSQYVDYKQTDAQHFDVQELLDFVSNKLSRRFILRHDLLPYEMTVVVHKNNSIIKPDNIYSIDK